MSEPIRIAMWSGPRNISTAMMRAFENRPDTSVVDEPFYAVYLNETNVDHPMREAVLASQSCDWQVVVADLLAPLPEGRIVHYQKHMTHHMLSGIGREWIEHVRSAFLIRAPEDVLLSYTEVLGSATLKEIGVPQQRELFDRECDRLGQAPAVIDAHDVLSDPRGVLTALCIALGIPFSERMLSWPAGRRASDGVWAPAWYAAVERSTGFAPPRVQVRMSDLPDALKPIAEAARIDYEEMARYRLRGAQRQA